mgnify:CR=1 FL=1
MSIEKFGDTYTPICDICGEELAYELDFMDAVKAKKDAGWKNRKVDGEWEDICPSCQDEEKK